MISMEIPKTSTPCGKSKQVAETEADLLDFWQTVKARFADEGVPFFDNISAKRLFNMGFTKVWYGDRAYWSTS